MANYESSFEAPTIQQISDSNSGVIKELPNLYNNFSTIQQQNFQPGKSGILSDGSIDFGQASSPYGISPYENQPLSKASSIPFRGDEATGGKDSLPITERQVPGDPVRVGPEPIRSQPVISKPISSNSGDVASTQPSDGHASQAGQSMQQELATLTQEIGQLSAEVQQLLNLEFGGTTPGGDGGAGSGTTPGGDGGTGGGTTSGGAGSETPGPLSDATGTYVANIPTVSLDAAGSQGTTVFHSFTAPPESTNLASTGNGNVNAMVALTQIQANSNASDGMDGGGSILADAGNTNDVAGIAAVAQAANDPNFVNDFVNAVNQYVIPVGNAAVEGASSRWNSNQQLGYAWQGGEDPFGSLTSELAEVQQQNPSLTGNALVQAVVQQMGSDFASGVEEQAAQANSQVSPGTIFH